MTKMQGVPEELWVRVTRKRGDGDYGSFGVEAELKINLANIKDLNLKDAFDAADAWLTASVAGSMKEKAETIAVAPEPAPQFVMPEHLVGQAPPEAPPVAPSSPQTQVAAESHEILDNCTISHQVTGSGIHHLLVKGGKFSKFGVKFWPEKAAEFIESDFTQWPIGQEYGLPDGYKEALVQMKPDGKPDRVVGLR